MRPMRAWFVRLFGLFARERREQELSAELEAHLQMHIDDGIRAGLSPEQARRQARIRLGGVEQVKESYRDRRGVPMLETMAQDLSYGIRAMRRSPGFTAAAVLTLGLGIGATTAVFTVVYAVLLRPLPYPQPDRLVYIKENLATGLNFFSTPREYVAWQKQSQTMSQLGAYMWDRATLTGAGPAERVVCGAVTASFLELLGAQPVLGRVFRPEEERAGGESVALISYSLWKRSFGGEAAALGKTLAVDGKSYTVIGVLPAAFRVPDRYSSLKERDYDVWVPFGIDSTGASGFVLLRTVGRLKPGVSRATAQAELDTILQPLLRKGRTKHVVLVDWHDEISGGVRKSLFFFLAAIGFVLLIACVNVANLLLSRAAAREREIAVRRALGAGRPRIVRQLLTESVLLAVAGGSAGLALAYWGKDLLVSFLSRNLPVVQAIRTDFRVLGFTLGVAVVTGLAFGLAPAVQSSGVRLMESLKESARSGVAGPSRSGLRNLLVVAEVALAMMVLIGAGLLFKSFLLMRGSSMGFQADHLLTASLHLAESKYPTPRDQSRFFQRALEEIRSVPGVQLAGAVDELPLGAFSVGGSAEIEGRTESIDRIDAPTVTPDYFRVMSIPLIAGRGFTDADRDGAPEVVLVNQSFARRAFPGENCLGKRIKSWNRKGEWMSIVGVVGDVRLGAEEETRPQMYFCYLQSGRSFMHLAARTPGDPASLAVAVRGRLAAIDKDQPPDDVMSMEQRQAEDLAPRKAHMLLLVTFAALGLALGAIGIYGVVSYSVSRRLHEIGVRIALGAHRGDVVSLVVGRGLLLVLAGELVGVAGALALNRVIATMVFHITTTDPLTYAGVALVWMLVGLAACYLPARRATRVDPMAALRCE